MKQNLFSNLTKKDGKLEYNIKTQETIYNNFVKNLPEGSKVEIFVSVSGDIGYSFSEMKLQIKRKSGLCFNKNGGEYCKSFGNCSKDELNSVIQEIIELGDELGSNLR